MLGEYVKDIYRLQSSVARANKPLFFVAPGIAHNSGATLALASNLPGFSKTTEMCFNECQIGMIPHAGATYYLSRMPGEMGTYLALSGDKFAGH
jgi:enoyl-CoA hydratase